MSIVITVLLIILAMVLIAFLSVMVFFAFHLRHLRKLQDSNERTLGGGEKKALLVYQPSKHSSTGTVAHSIAQNLAAQGYTVTVNYPRPDLSYKWSDYELIALGSPVYIGQTSPVLKYYVENHKSEGVHFLLFATGIEPDGGKELGEMASWLGQNNGVDAKKFWLKQPLDAGQFVTDSLANWAASAGPYFKIHAEQAEQTAAQS